MESSPLPSHSYLLDLERLEFDPSPCFVVRTSQTTRAFEFIFCNEALRVLGSRNVILAHDKAALLFRSWAQALGEFKPYHEFDGHTWTAQLAGTQQDWKIVTALKSVPEGQEDQPSIIPKKSRDIDRATVARNLRRRRSEQDITEELERGRTALPRASPRTSLDARWEGMQTMMEMSDIGSFEYNSEGKLLHANDAWYRLSSHPRNLPDHVEFSFMDLVYPDDQDLVMSMWNTLSIGKAVTFEMRWKSVAGSSEAAQWVLSSCVPVLDEEGNLISIAGNTIDINGQKKSQAAAQAQLEALEQARLSELKFERFSQQSPTAIYIYVPNSGMKFVNEQFFSLTGHPNAPIDQFEWFDLISDEDVGKVKEDWDSMLEGKKSNGVQFRLKKTWVNQDGVCSNIWVQSSSHPELDANGNVISILGTLFDISQFKWAESVQRRRIEEALEAKRQQENFIDMTSHELRNPLSAVVQCADSVISSLHQLPIQQLATSSVGSDLARVQADIMTCIESLHTIVTCSLHQKRVIDDVLTLSKLDSNLILITPIRVQPQIVVSEALKMFEVECNQMEIKLEFQIDESLQGIEWAMFDPSRLLQVLINLLTNAIKFTKERPNRAITVLLGGSLELLPRYWQDIEFLQCERPEAEILDRVEWGNGQKVYLWIKVRDTGCGMTLDEQRKLFARFSQATPRTHVKYGGSGLGLFISKSLAVLQGGSIGVHSESNVGTTFAFYIGSRLTHPPADQRIAQALQGRPTIGRTTSNEDAMRAIKLDVLIVEDNLVNQRVLKKQLQKFGWNVNVAGNGQEAIDWLKESIYWRINHLEKVQPHTMEDKPDGKGKHKLDVILMDVEMPIMDGLTCARLIRDYEHQGVLAMPHTFNIGSGRPIRRSLRLPILAVSANARAEQVQQAFAAGMDDSIAKPFRIPELWPKIHRLVGRLREDVDMR